MKTAALIIFILASTGWTRLPAHQQVTVDRHGRNIQVDGYLMEWHEKDVDTCQGTVSFMWDVINTSVGLAGYFRYRFTDSCSKMYTNFYPRMKKSSTFWMMDVDTILMDKLLYAVDKTGENGDTTVIAEWLLPWNALTGDTSGTYAVGILAYTACGDTMDMLMVSGKPGVKKERIVNNKIILQLITIFFLALAFYLLKAKAKKRYSKKS